MTDRDYVRQILKRSEYSRFHFHLTAIIKACTHFSKSVFVICFFHLLIEGGGQPVSDSFVKPGLLLLIAVIGLLEYFGMRMAHDLSFHILDALRTVVFDQYYQLAPGGVDGLNTGDFSQMLINDINVFEWYVTHILMEWYGAVLATIAVMLWLASYSIPFALAVTTCCILLAVYNFQDAEIATQSGIRLKNAGGKLMSVIIDSLNGLRELITFDKTSNFIGEINAASGHYNRCVKLDGRREEKKNRTINFSFSLFTVLCLLIAGRRMERFDRNWPVYFLSVYCFKLWVDVMSETKNYSFIYGAAKRVFAIFDRENPIKGYGSLPVLPTKQINVDSDICTPVGPVESGEVLVLDGVDFRYPGSDRWVLQKISFTVKRGEKVAVVSASGGGKSTLAKLIARFYDPLGGKIQWEGKDLSGFSEPSLRQLVTIVPQRTFFFQESVIENLRYADPDLVQDQAFVELAEAFEVNDFIMRKDCAYETKIGENGSGFSGGERQRLAILQAVIKGGPILILDEASSALDPVCEKRLNQALTEYGENRVLIILAHRIGTMRDADRILFLQDGRIKSSGSFDELMQRDPDFCRLIALTEKNVEEDN